LRTRGHRDGRKRIADRDRASARACPGRDLPEGQAGPPPPRFSGRPVGAFTPAVSDPRLAAELARRGAGQQRVPLHPGLASRRPQPRGSGRDPRPPSRPPGRARRRPTSALGGHRDHAQLLQSRRLGRLAALRRLRRRRPGPMAAPSRNPRIGQVGMSYRATRRFTGRVAVARRARPGRPAHHRRGPGYSLDVGGAYSIARNVDVTAGARYRIRATGSSRSPATTAATARPSTSEPPSASRRSRRRFPPSHKRREAPAPARVHAAERDHRQAVRRPARRSAPGRAVRARDASGWRRPARGRRGGAGALGGADLGDLWTGALRRPAAAAAVAAVGAPARACAAGPANSSGAVGAARTRSNKARRSFGSRL
jgi:hypothetical protein